MTESRRHAARSCALAVAAWLIHVASANAQQSVNDVLSFLLINRSIPTGDFIRDEQAAAATRDSISGLLLNEVATLPISASAAGFTYRLDSTLGTVVRSSDSFGAFFTERSLTVGRGQASFGVSYQAAVFQSIDGRALDDGTLVATASRLRGEPDPFDVETLTLRLRADTTTLAVNVGVTDRLDVSAAAPFVRVALAGQRLDTYRGQQLLQASGSATAAGLGDVVVRTKVNLLGSDASGLALGAEARLPTGSKDNLLGSGEVTFKPRAIVSFEGHRVGVHANFGYAFGGLARELEFSAATTAVARPTLTLIGELTGRRLEGLGHFAELTQPHPTLVGVDTVRLTGTDSAATRLVAVAGVKWNVASTWLVSANVTRPLTSTGLNARWVPTVTIDYAFGR